jgi:hypothetical protein
LLASSNPLRRYLVEAFSREDPFILEGLVKSFVIKDWNDSMLPE